jgi:AcrR family transcriptional regulator
MVRICAERGYQGATVGAVVERAGLDEAAFERHFADREDCFLAAYQGLSDVLVARTAAAFETPGRPWPERITLGLRALVELLASEPEIARMAIVEVPAIPGEPRVRSRELLDRFVPFLEQGREASPQGAALPPETARFAIGGATSLIFDELRAGRGTELKAILPELVFAVTMPYLGVAAAEAEMRRVRDLN